MARSGWRIIVRKLSKISPSVCPLINYIPGYDIDKSKQTDSIDENDN